MLNDHCESLSEEVTHSGWVNAKEEYAAFRKLDVASSKALADAGWARRARRVLLYEDRMTDTARHLRAEYEARFGDYFAR